MKEALLIFVPQLTPRVSYTFSLFFESLINTPYRLTTSPEEYTSYTGPKLCYAENKVGQDGIFIAAGTLLFESGITTQPIEIVEWNGLQAFFKTEGGSVPFDIFAASFYLVSRYEEYLVKDRDKHNRFKFENSLACKHNFIEKPLVNLWAAELKRLLVKNYPSLTVTENKYKFTPTIDIDVAYAHLGRSLTVTIGSALRALSKFKLVFLLNKKLTLLWLKKDIYDTYDYQEDIFKKFSLRPIYFFLAANRGAYDKNISTSSTAFKKLVKRISSFADVGIHPSYQSQNNSQTVKSEIERVEKNCKDKITKSRQHFLRVTFPETYQCLAQLGITDDYTLAHAAHAGFRASICTPFYCYDLTAEKTLPVKLHPTIVMEGTLKEYMRLNPQQAILLTAKLINEVKLCNGEFISIWHNQSLVDKGEWKGWRQVFETMIEKAI